MWKIRYIYLPIKFSELSFFSKNSSQKTKFLVEKDIGKLKFWTVLKIWQILRFKFYLFFSNSNSLRHFSFISNKFSKNFQIFEQMLKISKFWTKFVQIFKILKKYSKTVQSFRVCFQIFENKKLLIFKNLKFQFQCCKI